MRRETPGKSTHLAATSELTVIAPLRRGLVPALDSVSYKTRAQRVLKALHLGRSTAHESDLARVMSDAVERVGTIHSVAILVLEAQDPGGQGTGGQDSVMLTVTFDGAWESYVRVIWQKVARLLDLIFCNTDNYVLGGTSSYQDWGDWLRRHQAASSFLYAPPGVTAADTRVMRSLERHQRRHGAEGAPADLQAVRLRVVTAEETAERAIFDTDLDGDGSGDGAGLDPANALDSLPHSIDEAGRPAFRQGLRSLVGLHRLTDLHPPHTADGAVLHRAARELLPEFLKMLRSGNTYQLGRRRALRRFDEALAWFEADLDPKLMPVPARQPPPLPVAPPSDLRARVQGGIVHAYEGVEVGALLLLGFDGPAALASWLARVQPHITTDAQTLAPGHIARNLAFTLEGLRCAGLSEDEVQALPEDFQQGMARRAGLLGDLRVNHPRRWRLPVRNWAEGVEARDVHADEPAARVELAAVHAVLQLRLVSGPDAAPEDSVAAAAAVAAQRAVLHAEMQRLVGAPGSGVQPLSIQWTQRVLRGGQPGEHFGFADGRSQPVFDPDQAGKRYPNLVHLGEVLCGHANRADAAWPVPDDARQPAGVRELLYEGSFLVVRKLRQDLQALDRAIHDTQQLPGQAGLDRATLLAHMMGRWPAEGSPLGSDGKPLDGKPLAWVRPGDGPNDFHFDADPEGRECPLHAHIRRANPRDTRPEPGSRPARIVRRGMSYGPVHVPVVAPPDADAQAVEQARQANDASLAQERGLVFMAYNASLGEQFEVVQRWLAGGNSAGGSSNAADPFFGLAEPGRRRHNRCEIAGRVVHMALDGSDALHDEPQPIVRLEWGLYALAPSLPALAWLRQRAQAAAANAATKPPVAWTLQQGRDILAALREVERREGPLAARDAWKVALEDPQSALDFSSHALWQCVRDEHGGVLRTPYGVLVASETLARQVLVDREGRYTATGYLPRMQRSFGGIFLGLDAGQPDGAYERESEACNDAIMKLLDPEDSFQRARASVQARLAALQADAERDAREDGETHWELTLDVRELIDALLADFCEQWFGLGEQGGHFRRSGFRWQRGGDERACYPGDFMAPSRYFFQPHPGPEVEARGSADGQGLQRAMAAYLARHGGGLTAPVARAVLDSAPARADPGFAPRTLVGAVMGFVPTVDGTLRRILGEWLGEGTLWGLRARHGGTAALGLAAARKQLGPAMRSAWQLRSAPDVLWRTAVVGHVLGQQRKGRGAGPGKASRAVAVQPGDLVVVGLASVLQADLARGVDNVDLAFGGDRWAAPAPTHACPGAPAAMALMLGFLAGLVESGLPLQPGPTASSLHLAGVTRPFPPVHAIPRPRLGALPPLPVTRGDTGSVPPPVVALGDSWLLFIRWAPQGWHSLASALEASQRVTVKPAFCSPGRRLAEIAAGEGLREAESYFANLRPEQPKPVAVLLCGGGNDLVHPTAQPRATPLFGLLKAGATDPALALDDRALTAFIDGTLRSHFVTILDRLVKATELPILVHAYDHPWADGRKRPGGGPWLKPVFDAADIHDPTVSRGVMRTLIERLDGMVAGLLTHYPGRLHHVSLRAVLEAEPGYAADHTLFWNDELHATERGYQRLADEFLRVLGPMTLPPPPSS